MTKRAARKWSVFDRLSQFWASDRGLSIFSALLLIVVFVLPLFPPRGGVRSVLGDVIFSLLLVAGVRALGTGWLARMVLMPVTVLTVTAYFASRFVAVDELWVELASLVSVVCLFIVVIGQTFRDGPITLHRIQGAIAAYLLMGIAWANAYNVIEMVSPGAFSGAIQQGGGARRWFYFSFVTLTTVGYGDILPVHPVARSLAILEAVAGPLYLAILLARLVSLAVTPGQSRTPG